MTKDVRCVFITGADFIQVQPGIANLPPQPPSSYCTEGPYPHSISTRPDGLMNWNSETNESLQKPLTGQ